MIVDTAAGCFLIASLGEMNRKVLISEPIAAKKAKYNETEWTLWDRNEFQDVTLQEVIDEFQNKHKLEVSMVSCGTSMLWASFQSKARVSHFAHKALWMLTPILTDTDGTTVAEENWSALRRNFEEISAVVEKTLDLGGRDVG